MFSKLNMKEIHTCSLIQVSIISFLIDQSRAAEGLYYVCFDFKSPSMTKLWHIMTHILSFILNNAHVFSNADFKLFSIEFIIFLSFITWWVYATRYFSWSQYFRKSGTVPTSSSRSSPCHFKMSFPCNNIA